MSEKQLILGRIREALKMPAPEPGSHGHEAPAAHASGQITSWLPAVGESSDEKLALFSKNSEELKTNFRIAKSAEDLHEQLKELAAAEGWTKVAAHSNDLVTPAVNALGLPLLLTDASFDKHELEKCDAGISGCEALIAQTGSVLVSNQSSGGRALSVLPPHHVVIARREQLLGDLSDGFALLKQRYGDGFPSFIGFITGPSRTGDIERILVLGAHGPKKLTVFCV